MNLLPSGVSTFCGCRRRHALLRSGIEQGSCAPIGYPVRRPPRPRAARQAPGAPNRAGWRASGRRPVHLVGDRRRAARIGPVGAASPGAGFGACRARRLRLGIFGLPGAARALCAHGVRPPCPVRRRRRFASLLPDRHLHRVAGQDGAVGRGRVGGSPRRRSGGGEWPQPSGLPPPTAHALCFYSPPGRRPPMRPHAGPWRGAPTALAGGGGWTESASRFSAPGRRGPQSPSAPCAARRRRCSGGRCGPGCAVLRPVHACGRSCRALWRPTGAAARPSARGSRE